MSRAGAEDREIDMDVTTEDPTTEAVPVGPGTRWITVDLDRIRRLPDRLRCLWPRDLLPGDDEESDPDPTAAAPGTAGPGTTGPDSTDPGTASARVAFVSPTSTALAALPAEVVRPRDLDVLSAWLAGFAAELNLTGSRLTVVVGARAATVHLELALCAQTCLAILALRGEGFADFAGYEFLRRLDLDEVGTVCEELTGLVDDDCVLTLTYAGACAGMEFLHRQDGTWSRPLLDRAEAGMTVARMERAGTRAVRTLLAGALTQLIYLGAGSP